MNDTKHNRAAVLASLALAGCSLIVNPHERNAYDLVDSGQTRADGGSDAGPRDAGHDASTDAGLDAALPPLEPPVLRWPWNGWMSGSVHTGALEPPRNALRPRFIWEAVPGAATYEIQLSWRCDSPTRHDCDFAGATIGLAPAPEWRPDAPLDVSMSRPVGRRYYWRVRACHAEACSPWSDVRYLDVGRQLTDFNGDGYADVLTGGMETASSASAYLYTGPALDGTMRRSYAPGADDAAVGYAVGDVDGDGFPDAVLAINGSPPALRPIRGGSVPMLEPIVNLTGATSCSGGPLSAGDLNGDGFSDVVVPCSCEPTTSTDGRVCVLEGGSLSFPERIEFQSPMPQDGGRFGRRVVASTDVDGDGYVDLVVGSEENGAAVDGAGRTYIFRGSSAFSTSADSISLLSPEPSLGGAFGYAYSGGDLNCDGFGDLLIGENSPTRMHIFHGDRLGPTTPDASVALEVSVLRGAGGGDVDGDGTGDVLAYRGSDESIYFWRGACGGISGVADQVLSSPSGTSDGFNEAFGFVGDIDGDGDDEVVFGAPWGSPPRVYVHRWATSELAPWLTLEDPGSLPAIGYWIAAGR